MSSEVQIAVIDQQDTQIVLAVPGVQGATGSPVSPGGTANQVLRKASSTNYDTDWSLVTNAMVDSSAAIAGTKISPNFGSQNVVTTGTSTAASFIPTSSSVPTNGVYLPSANNVAISTNGTQKIVVDANGKVGIGGNGTGNNLGVYLQNGGGTSVHFYEASDGTKTMIAGADSGQDFVKIGSLSNHPIGLVTNNGEKLRITTDGKLGLGTSSAADGCLLTLQESASLGAALALRNRNSTQTWRIAVDATAIDDKKLAFIDGTSSTVRMTVTDAGAVGIGTTEPSNSLEVAFSAANSISGITITNGQWFGYGARLQFRNLLTSAGTVGETASIYGEGDGSNAGRLVFHTTAGGTASERARIDSSGRLLVGTSTSALEKLVVLGDGGGVQINRNQTGSPTSGQTLGSIGFKGTVSANSNSAAEVLIQAVADENHSGSTAGSRIEFHTKPSGTGPGSSPTERMRITSRGVFKASNTGSYLSSDSNVHEIRNNTDNNNVLVISSAASNGTQYGLSIRTENDQNDATRDFLECQGGGVLRAQIRSNGGLANFSANNANLSDRNAKKDISPAADTWNCLKEWEIVNYRYKDQPDDADLSLGVIAQQVAESCPEVITIFQEAKEATDDEPAREERLGVKEQQMYWMAIKALQEAQVRIETLEAKVAALEGV
jgi:hypothetical protein